ncbi:flippase activity-associated protein Agl23 [Opitutus terrae]|uniref:Membrane-bound mannosyltransferase-like protein n=1 Tax=Opitutus terrae (strain DSM 11246 / JCM 15787 / PB90-1) TaxID=452637 RepID=B1ZVC5_OPITP|nr:flippase activity-associated protein Agl23 [Opitutus terrae]ACB76792.1 membrane-bound mannosyltransferase-like protein [Opitutus terrae PB90-1]
MSSLFQRWLPLTLIAVAALALRTWQLSARPMHADEANQAVKLGQLLETGRYAFDPRDHHGPTLYYAAVPIAMLRGEQSLATLTETTVRLTPALAGTLSVLLLALLLWPERTEREPAAVGDTAVPATPASPWPALAAATFLAVSPPAVYYSRYFIQETLLVTFTLGAFVCAQRWWRRPRISWAIAAGICVGLMQATKATAPLFLVAAAVAFAAVRPRGTPTSLRGRGWRDLALALVTAALVAAAFYSSFGTHWSGLRDAILTYTSAADRAASGAGHEKPWWYYLQLLGWQRTGGLFWHEIAFTALACCGAALAFLKPASWIFRAAALYTLWLVLTFSAIPYKTPWHVIHLIPGLAVLAAGALAALAASAATSSRAPVEGATAAGIENARRFRRLTSRVVIGFVFLAVLQTLYAQTRLAVFQRPADARNPYAYVHSSPDVQKVPALAGSALAFASDGVIRVISEEYWPLPWYLREFKHVGYWSTPPDDCDAALVIASEALADEVRARLHGRYRESLLGLRPGFLLVVFTRES